ncbi:HlyD family efflux transporter periplasmic adaptor subunit [Pontibacter sp. BT310]|uniref:HlyD family efflux transporter periplasmic adaptor subunit n=1 Tax=Pontibacter populi TaxID=890055 RepID=A0ABS6XCN6_9BACT|nr:MULTISPECIES: HlyD family efflux transporter periplasmic adaptor subunit [Pontibacter]MBJ6118913.1 HlyD family efflux transporter periplasmic adaptor subunit [Pontibacter sp. BT310]MBR0571341.1 HlyD family efflux transporter periplasmic adaptor subunit [Microvirga sp. STS03]MBW3365767.1 HlyD family efflux transporter periplasmic adaptor subunit [Pontibacter populi]
MDRELSATTKQANKRRRYWQIGITLALLAFAIVGFRSLLTPSLSRDKLRTAVVERGPVVATISASGVVVPENELVITSPIQARIEQVLLKAGEQVKPGDQILLLDRAFTQLAYDKLKDEQQLNQHKSVQLRLNLRKTLNQLASQLTIKQMRVKSLQAQLEDEKYLLKIGGTTQESVKQAELNLKIAQQELQEIERDMATERELLKADEQELGFTLAMQGRSIEELQRKMEQAEVRATHNGVITWVKNEIGSTVNAGDIIARLADLSSYKVKATISDTYAGQLLVGGNIIVRVNNADLQGTISSIEPTVSNGIVTFYVALQDKAHQLLRPSLRVDVFVTMASKGNVLRVKNGPYFNSAKGQQVFIVQGDEVLRKPAAIGVSNVDFVELENGVQPGDVVVISEMAEYEHTEKLKLK